MKVSKRKEKERKGKEKKKTRKGKEKKKKNYSRNSLTCVCFVLEPKILLKVEKVHQNYF
jgi:hypothetical protein